jgi:hypothetical protein
MTDHRSEAAAGRQDSAGIPPIALNGRGSAALQARESIATASAGKLQQLNLSQAQFTGPSTRSQRLHGRWAAEAIPAY